MIFNRYNRMFYMYILLHPEVVDECSHLQLPFVVILLCNPWYRARRWFSYQL